MLGGVEIYHNRYPKREVKKGAQAQVRISRNERILELGYRPQYRYHILPFIALDLRYLKQKQEDEEVSSGIFGAGG